MNICSKTYPTIENFTIPWYQTVIKPLGLKGSCLNHYVESNLSGQFTTLIKQHTAGHVLQVRKQYLVFDTQLSVYISAGVISRITAVGLIVPWCT